MRYLIKIISFTYCANLRLIEGIFCKILLIQVEKYWDEPNLKKQKDMKEGYFLYINDYVILLFRIKDEFKSFDESYNILFKQSQNILNNLKSYYFE